MALFKNFCAERYFLRLVKGKATVLPCLATALYK